MEMRSKPLRRGPKWMRQAFNDLRADIIANRVRAGVGTTVTESANGTAVNAAVGQTGQLAGGT